MSDVPWTDPKFDLTEENRVKLERALQRAHRRAPGRSQADLHEHGTVSEGVEYGRPVPPTAREDWHQQQREQALAEQAGHDQEIGHTLQDASNSVARRILGSSTVAPRDEWHARQRRDVWYDQHPDRQREERGSTQTPGLYDPHPPTQTREDWHANQRGEESPTEALWRRIEAAQQEAAREPAATDGEGTSFERAPEQEALRRMGRR